MSTPRDGYSDQSFLRDNTVLAFELERVYPALERRRQVGSLRKLTLFHTENAVDFSSNDYLGLAQSHNQQKMVEKAYESLPTPLLGATGSRLLTGDSWYAQKLETKLAKWHNRKAALLCNSGYDANLAVLSCLGLDSIVIMDELCHNSIQMGVRLSKNCIVKKFLHNNLNDLRRILTEKNCLSSAKRQILVVVESVYSMDGDMAPLKGVLQTAKQHQASVIVDEAHGLGVFGQNGMGVLAELGLENHPALLCSVHTFGKAAGCHGAVVCSSLAIKTYLYNYGRPIVYSTSLPLHSLVAITCSYQSMAGVIGKRLRKQMCGNIEFFRINMGSMMKGIKSCIALVPSKSPIQAMIVPGNHECIEFCDTLWNKSNNRIRLYPIRSPTVPKGQERVRIILHAQNCESDIFLLIGLIRATLEKMGYSKDKRTRSRL